MISIYCSETLDGVAAAAIVLRHANLMKLPAHFGGFLNPQDLSAGLDDLSSEENKLLFVVDVSVSPELLPLVEKVAQKNKIVYWNSPDVNCVVVPSKLFDGFKEGKCAAELVYERFLPRDTVARELAQMAHQIKFWQLSDERAMKLSNLIAAQYDAFELLQSLAKGVFWNDKFEKFHEDYEKKKSLAFDEMMKSLVIKSYINYRFGFVLVPVLLPSATAAQRVLDAHAGVDVSVVLFKDGRVAFRRRDAIDLNLVEVAQVFGGGGKEFASGAKLSMSVTKDSYGDVVFYIDQALKNYFVRV
jgi:oligoribonuclease NrnB/cAMP/cGMP phosphodiesterase (DHH superfamily)